MPRSAAGLYRGIRELRAIFRSRRSSVKQEDALRIEIHQALDGVTGPTPELLQEIAPRPSPGLRRRRFLAIGQVAAVLAS